jgi:ribosome-binding ATPase YchF (GTP1/OBG family)
MDAFLMVVRNFHDSILGPPRAAGDSSDLEDELILADLATVEKRLEKLAMEEKRGKKITGNEKELLESCREVLDAGQSLKSRPELASAPELRGFTFLSGKPALVIFNNEDEDDRMPEGPCPPQNTMVVRGKLEMEMAQLSEEEVLEFRKDFGIGESALNRDIERSFQLLRLASFFTEGEDEVKARTIPRDTPAHQAAGCIHSDIQRGFIRAEKVAYGDLYAAGDYAAARKQGTVRLEGKHYPVQDGDVIHFRFNV